MTPAISRLISFILAALILTHVFACLWFLTAKFAEFSPDTWVTRKGLQDETPGVQYAYAMHWATQTITTVGYGEIPAATSAEIYFSFTWMLLGVLFYSFIIGNFSSISESEDEANMNI